MIGSDILQYNDSLSKIEQAIGFKLSLLIDGELNEATNTIWHSHPVWFIDGNPIVGYSKIKAGIRLMFWSGADFEESILKPGTGKFKDASIVFTSVDQINEIDIIRCLQKSKDIQWDYKNIVKRKGKLERLK